MQELVRELDAEQAAWLAGYLAGISARLRGGAEPVGLTSVPAEEPRATLNILFGSQTGNASRLAEELRAAASAAGIEARVLAMSDCDVAQLSRLRDVAAIVSTHGEGEPPDAAAELFRRLAGQHAPRLDGLRFTVLALGDSSYASYCKAGSDLDTRLAELGGARVVPRVDCDVDFREAAARWMQAVVAAWRPKAGAGDKDDTSVSRPAPPETPRAPAVITRDNPALVPVLERVQLNGRGSDRQTLHVELSLESCGATYEPGDAIGILPRNCPELVHDIVVSGGWRGDEAVTRGHPSVPISEALMRHHEIAIVSRRFAAAWAARGGHESLAAVASARDGSFEEYARGRGVLEVITEHPITGLAPQELVTMLGPLRPRLYSIASSLRAHPGEAHLTVGVLRYQMHGREHKGVCSTYVADRVGTDDELPVFVQPNPRFRLPAPDVPVIMVGAGTGIAPFRAFVEEREVTGAPGRNWLFFGERRFTTDFLYQVEWRRRMKSGLLTRMDVAFSRDQPTRIYVQHRMREHARELWGWLQDGAHLYVCGDARRMAKDVHQTLLDIAAEQGALSREDAEAALSALTRQRRYQRDVW